ncbi:hypothetical protein NB688_003555 [Xanthomonas sacchari]|uniref:Zinc ribbon domain-containing protein n=2 Tax=Xanthomonas sacchari TaxID=56458 RepID=A0ABT3DYJ4_9XANT|nr:hypothetical protein [Xanthomonas sacchari]MCW0400024.1 hypothetical protein [Xanthomonas sacchari]MCW0421389.1 hypothetical protein [Xanthomonas sacchari]UYK72847.1 hypothetical protein NG828_00370 [Xanthomonas sacchari]
MAKDLYCWRCDKVVPMFDDEEWEAMGPALSESIDDIKELRREAGISLREALAKPHGQRALKLHQELTGQTEPNLNVIWHHRLSIYGPPCRACGKPLRTPRAKLCAACGRSVST